MATNNLKDQASNANEPDHEPLEHCSICQQRFTEPKMLDCLHSYCLKCLEDLIPNNRRNPVNVQCPVCKQNTVLPEEGLNGLVECSSLASLVLGDYDVGQRSRIMCEACDQDQQAVSRCADCEDYLCKDCQDAHQRMLKMRSHNIVTLPDTRHSDYEDVPKCNNHAGQELCFFCNTCQVVICAACTVVAHSQPEHNYVDFQEAGATFRHKVKALFAEAEIIQVEQEIARDSTQHSRDRLETLMTEAQAKVSKQANEYHACIQQLEEHLLSKLDEINHKRAVEIDISLTNQNQILASTERRLDTVKTFMSKATPYELLAKRQTVLKGFRGIKAADNQDHGILHKLSFVDFRPGPAPALEPLGILLLEEQWKLQKEFTMFKMARGVAINSHGHLAVVDSEQNFLIIITDLASPGNTKNSVGMQIENLKNPFTVCTNSQDQLIVIDSPTVKVFSKDWKLLFQFTPSRGNKEDESKSLLSALAVDCNDQIAIGDRGRGVITFHNHEGILIRTLQSTMVENQLEVCSKPDSRLIYTSYESNRLTSTDYEGNIIFSVNTLTRAKFRNPTGVCCCPTGDILVAGHLDIREQSGIYYFNPVGEYLGCIALGLCNPLSMVLGLNGELIVADKLTVKVYQTVRLPQT